MHFEVLEHLGLIEREPSSFQLACEEADRAAHKGRGRR
jgi:hypothetical protein